MAREVAAGASGGVGVDSQQIELEEGAVEEAAVLSDGRAEGPQCMGREARALHRVEHVVGDTPEGHHEDPAVVQVAVVGRVAGRVGANHGPLRQTQDAQRHELRQEPRQKRRHVRF